MRLTAAQLNEKIAAIDADIIKMRREGTVEKKINTLVDYKAYLQDELAMLNSTTTRK